MTKHNYLIIYHAGTHIGIFSIMNSWSSNSTCNIPHKIYGFKVDDEINGRIYIAIDKGVLIYNIWNEWTDQGLDILSCEQAGKIDSSIQLDFIKGSDRMCLNSDFLVYANA